MIKRSIALVVALGGLCALPACTSGQAAAPPYTPVNVAGQSQLQFQVGTATLPNGTLGLNTVTTFRQTSGLSAVLASTPSIQGPAGFVNTAPAQGSNGDGAKPPDITNIAGTDSGTSPGVISGVTQAPAGTKGIPPTTFGQSVGAFAYGFLPVNSNQTGSNNSVFYPGPVAGSYGFRMPEYYSGTRRAYYVGPGNAFVSNFKDGSLGTAFNGYPSGFTSFAVAPANGTYTLTVAVPGNNVAAPSFTSTATLNTATQIPAFAAAPVFTANANADGGGTVAVIVPAGATETAVFLRDARFTSTGAVAAFYYYTLVTKTTGAQTLVLPPNLGPITAGTAGPSTTAGDQVTAYAVAFDYPALEAVPVGAGPAQAPVINNAGQPCSFSGLTSTCPGQADISMSLGNTTQL